MSEGRVGRWVERRVRERPGARELKVVLGLMVLALAVRVAFVLVTQGYELAGDQLEYDVVGRSADRGYWFWTPFPYGIAHESVARPPGYMAFIGLVYSVIGPDVTGTLLVQSLFGPLVVFLVWLLARRLFDARVALVAAALAALYPNMWQWETRLYSESLALPLSLIMLNLVLEQRATATRAVATGLAMGAGLLVRPSSGFFFALIFAAWWSSRGFKTGVALTAVTVAVAALVVAPWTIRNYVVSDHLVLVSVQDAAVAGTFNPDSAADRLYPWAWRPVSSRDADIFGVQATRRLSDGELRDELQSRAFDFIGRYPTSVPKAFFWNGLSRTWDVRRPSRALNEVVYEGRDRTAAEVGLWSYWVLLAGALAALWRLRARRSLVVPVLAGAAAMSIVFTICAGSRYRVPFEPIVVVLAASTFVALADRLRPRPATSAATPRSSSGAPA